MASQSHATVWTAFMSPVADEVNLGDVLIPNAAGDGYVVATLANRTAASRTLTGAGVALTEWDPTNPNRAVEIQTVGPYPRGITELGAGSATSIRVSDAGRLERGSSGVMAGTCDADGFAYLNFTGTGNSLTGAPTDATYVTLSTSGLLTNERVLTAGTGITVTDAGAGSTVTVAAPGMAAPFITQALSGDLANERVLTAGAGITLTDGGAGSTMTVAAPAVAAQYVTLATSADLANERVLTAGTNISIVDGGAGSTVTINNTAPTPAPLSAQYITVALDATLTNERRLQATSPIQLSDGGAGGDITISTTFTASSTTTLTNKTISTLNNSIVATAQGQLLKGNNSLGVFETFNRGTALQVLRVNSGGTDLEWAAPAASGAPTDATYVTLSTNGTLTNERVLTAGTQITLTDAGAGSTITVGVTPGSNGQFLGVVSSAAAWTNNANFFAAYNSAAASGLLRAANATDVVVGRNSTNSADIPLLSIDNANGVRLGLDNAGTGQAANCRINGVNFIYQTINGSNYLVLQSSYVATLQPLHVGSTIGGSADFTNKFRFARAAVAVNAGSTLTLTAAQYACPFIVMTGTGAAGTYVLTPSVDGAFYIVWNNTANSALFGEATDDSETITSGRIRMFIGDASIGSYYRNCAPEGDT